ncbi:MAG: DNA-directed RNA polymerase subunit alpha C-terminal domain-containing protein [Elusimicrobiota bacterium]|nr:DNA-directed RNA polymerase subunit alpha C-terminal domain-containing protein [Elusimicrobiota bacterium]
MKKELFAIDELFFKEMRKKICKLANLSKPIDIQILALRFGIGREKPLSFKEIGTEVGLSVGAVQQRYKLKSLQIKQLFTRPEHIIGIKNSSMNNFSVENLDFSVRLNSCLSIAGICTIEDLRNKSEGDLMQIKGFGRKCLNEVKEKLQDYKLSLKQGSCYG